MMIKMTASLAWLKAEDYVQYQRLLAVQVPTVPVPFVLFSVFGKYLLFLLFWMIFG